MKQGAAAIVLFLVVFVAACNPFAPELDQSAGTTKFGDPHTVEGFFTAFHYAYEFRDTTLYGSLLAPNFAFSYHNRPLNKQLRELRSALRHLGTAGTAMLLVQKRKKKREYTQMLQRLSDPGGNCEMRPLRQDQKHVVPIADRESILAKAESMLL